MQYDSIHRVDRIHKRDIKAGKHSTIYTSHCCGNVHLNDDSKSQRHTPNAWRMILNHLDVCGGQMRMTINSICTPLP